MKELFFMQISVIQNKLIFNKKGLFMNHELSFKNAQGQIIIKFNNFKFEDDEYFENIIFDLNVEYNLFKLKMEIISEIGDFAYLSEGLQKIFKNEITKAYFEPIDRNFSINFSVNEKDDLTLYFNYNYLDFKVKLSFEFNVEKNKIPEFVENIRTIIKSKEE